MGEKQYLLALVMSFDPVMSLYPLYAVCTPPRFTNSLCWTLSPVLCPIGLFSDCNTILWTHEGNRRSPGNRVVTTSMLFLTLCQVGMAAYAVLETAIQHIGMGHTGPMQHTHPVGT